MTTDDERRKRYETAIGATDIHNAHVIRLAAHAAMAVADAEQQALHARVGEWRDVASAFLRCATNLRTERDALHARIGEYENAITWGTSCLACTRVLDSAYRETVRAEQAEAERAQLQARLDRAEQTFPIATHPYQGAGFLSPCTATGYGNTCGQASHDHEDEGHTCHTYNHTYIDTKETP